MIEEQLIGFELAIIAKEKGFKEDSRYCFDINGKIYNVGHNNSIETDQEVYSAPTQSLLQRWLRDKFGIFVDCSHSRINDDGIVTLYQTQITSILIGETYNFKHHSVSRDCYGITYEEALEAGLQEGLKLIKTKG